MRLQIGRGLPEIAARGRFDTVIAVAEIHHVQIRLEDLRLGIALFEADGNRRLADLSIERPHVRQLLDSPELLCDRAAAFDDAARAPVAPRRLCDAEGIQTVVCIEAAILNRQHRVDHARRHAIDRHVDPLLDEEGKRLVTVPIEHHGRLRPHADLGERRRIRQRADDTPRRAQRGRRRNPHQDRGQQQCCNEQS